jgi:hypothetical protein
MTELLNVPELTPREKPQVSRRPWRDGKKFTALRSKLNSREMKEAALGGLQLFNLRR